MMASWRSRLFVVLLLRNLPRRSFIHIRVLCFAFIRHGKGLRIGLHLVSWMVRIIIIHLCRFVNLFNNVHDRLVWRRAIHWEHCLGKNRRRVMQRFVLQKLNYLIQKKNKQEEAYLDNFGIWSRVGILVRSQFPRRDVGLSRGILILLSRLKDQSNFRTSQDFSSTSTRVP